MEQSRRLKGFGLRGVLLRVIFARRTGSGAKTLSERIAAVNVPLLLFHGTGDQIVPAWHSEDIALAAGENARLVFVEGAEHGLSRFVEPKRYYDELLRFFENAL